MYRHLFVAVFLLAAVVSVTAQRSGPKSDKVAVRVNLIVLDENSEHVPGIKASDITLTENDVAQPVTSIRQFASGVDIALVIDNSGSVRRRMGEFEKIGKRLVADMMPGDMMQIIRFVTSDQIEIIAEWTDDPASLREALELLFVEGGQTAVYDAIYLAAENLIERNKNRPDRKQAIILLSDGEDRYSFHTEKQLFNLLSGNQVPVFTIAFTKDLPRWDFNSPNSRKTVGEVTRFVDRLAFVSGGTSYLVNERSNDEQLRDFANEILSNMRSQYVVTYQADTTKKTKSVRKLAATVADGPDGEKRRAVIRNTIVIALPKK
ncbi:MAG: VWA domain-containing protein [Acidobacteria bacterium]|nr:VWA domain-containing protein [Acidobacteriota bacterium]